MKRKSFTIALFVIAALLLAGCSESTDGGPAKIPESAAEETKVDETSDSRVAADDASEKIDDKEKASGKKSLAERMAGKYSYHYSAQDGSDEFYIMDVVPFGDNLYAYCGQAMPEDDESLEAYSFWAAEFIPYDADEMKSRDGDTVSVNELCFSVMSNAGMYWNAGTKGTITLTDDGLVFEGFEDNDFLVPEYDDSRLFLKDDRVEDAFGYLKHEPGGGDELQGFWILDNVGADLYLKFDGSDLYIYRKEPDAEVLFVAGGCDFDGRSFLCTASRLGFGGQPIELSGEYKIDDDILTLKFKDSDLPEGIPANARYSRVKDGRVHVTENDELSLRSESFGMYGGSRDYDELTSQDFYGVFVSSAKEEDKCTPALDKLAEAGFDGSCAVYTPDFDGLNPEPYYAVTAGLYTSESEADSVLSDVKAAGFSDAYVKKAGSYIGDRFCYIMHDSEKIEILKDGAMLRGVTLTLPYPADADSMTADLLVPKDAVFYSSADTGSFGNYEKDDSPYDWIVRNYDLMHEDIDRYLMYGPALSGVFEVSLKEGRITGYYGAYWWD
ncbi:MAG: SPOR domain-containing protein [Lachnospiraceae bacterium]|nr:SPOR domain-containing protein [Lachnospiraceae bacterium]